MRNLGLPTAAQTGCLLVLFFFYGANARAVLSRDDVDVQEYISLAADPAFAGARFSVHNVGGGVSGTAVLIAPDLVLFSAHLLFDATTSTLRQGTVLGSSALTTAFSSDIYNTFYYSGYVETPDGIYTNPFGNEYWSLDPSSVQVNPMFLGAPGTAADFNYDMAVARIVPGRIVENSVAASTMLPQATPMRLLDRPFEVGEQITIIGEGGTGSPGHAPGSPDDPARSENLSGPHVQWRAFQNIQDGLYATGNEYDFDSPVDPMLNLSGSSKPLWLEGTTAPGDSGGAWMVREPGGEWAVGGTTVGGSRPASADYAYGEVGIGTNLADSRDWLASMGATVVPEPSSFWLLAFSSAIFAFASFAWRKQ